jgi:hypothetical protein
MDFNEISYLSIFRKPVETIKFNLILTTIAGTLVEDYVHLVLHIYIYIYI